ncbi:hypothetical protein SAMN05216548_114132 [Faunimonas pinastri]|uniref:Uncharacterized protein n=1 Tax=Faunimonas pinastri TaxID=1855383 RepID=A0A1H9N0X6_9HYPH|nr:hypothetical protein [Faunimonas pinastri]SER29471.1 hypothetical protein SAMN05216548_114132 [Faunimonas pinastri]
MDEEWEQPELSRSELDLMAFRLIKPEWMEFERSLYASKWFDYRYMHPLEATFEYVRELGRVYRDVFAETRDRDAAEHVRVVSVRDFFEGGKDKRNKLIGCWRGRWAADAIGMPYGVYLTLAYRYTLRYWRQRYLPQPQQLYSERVLEQVVEEWEKRQASILYLGQHEEYQIDLYRETQPQNDHHEWLFRQAELRDNPAPFYARFTYGERILPESKLRARVDSDMFERIQSYA